MFYNEFGPDEEVIGDKEVFHTECLIYGTRSWAIRKRIVNTIGALEM